MFGNKMSPFLESGTDLTRQSQMCRSPGESGRAERRKVKVGNETTSPHTYTRDISSRELSPKANSLGQALKCFIFVWIFQCGFFLGWANQITESSALCFVVWTPRHPCALPFASKNQAKQNNVRNSIMVSNVLDPGSCS